MVSETMKRPSVRPSNRPPGLPSLNVLLKPNARRRKRSVPHLRPSVRLRPQAAIAEVEGAILPAAAVEAAGAVSSAINFTFYLPLS